MGYQTRLLGSVAELYPASFSLGGAFNHIFGSTNRVHVISKLCSCGLGSLGYSSGSGRDLRFVKHLGARAQVELSLGMGEVMGYGGLRIWDCRVVML